MREESKPKKKKRIRKVTRLCLGFGSWADHWRYRLQWRTHVPDEMEKFWWGWPGPCRGSQSQVPTGCHILLWGNAHVAFLSLRGWWQKRKQELTLLNTSDCHIWLWVSSGERRSSTCLDTIKMAWEDVLWRASIVSVPNSSLSALKLFHAVEFAHPSWWRGRRISV